jgi:hypothetical protein
VIPPTALYRDRKENKSSIGSLYKCLRIRCTCELLSRLLVTAYAADVPRALFQPQIATSTGYCEALKAGWLNMVVM